MKGNEIIRRALQSSGTDFKPNKNNMSYWYEPKIEDIDITEDGEEMHVYLYSNKDGAVYVSLNVEDVKKILGIVSTPTTTA